MSCFLVFEGIDGTGKSTQVGRLAKQLRLAGEDVVESKEPTDGPWGRKLRESAESGRLSLPEELRHFVEDRKEHIRDLIQPSLDAGRTVILDRYYYSTIAYQGARGASVDDLQREMRSFAPEPDLVFLMDLDPSMAISRIEQQRGEVPNQFERLESLEKVRSIFLQLEKDDSRIQIIDASQSVDAIHNDVLAALAKVCGGGPP